jgi:hypothetical protein
MDYEAAYREAKIRIAQLELAMHTRCISAACSSKIHPIR